MLFEQPLDDLRYEEDAEDDADAEGDQDLKEGDHLIDIEVLQCVDEVFYGADDLEIVAEDHHDQRTADAGDDHGGGCDHTHQEEDDHRDKGDVVGSSFVSGLRNAEQDGTDQEKQEEQHVQDHARAAGGFLLLRGFLFCFLEAEEKHWQASKDQANEAHGRRERMVADQVGYDEGEGDDAERASEEDGQQDLHTLFELLEDAGDGSEHFVVDAEHQRERTAADTGHDIRDTDDAAFDKIDHKIHEILLNGAIRQPFSDPCIIIS